MRILSAVLTVTLLAAPARAQTPRTEEEKTLYVMGLLAARTLRDFNLTAREAELVKRGFGDALSGRKPLVEVAAYEREVQQLAHRRVQAAAVRAKEQSKALEESAAKEKGAVKAASGLVYLSLKEGAGESPKATDTVKVHYEGKFPDGTVFDSSYKRGEPAEIALNGVIPCWTEGVQRMKVGGKARLVCPPKIAYGDAGRPPVIPGGVTLVFEVELLEVKK